MRPGEAQTVEPGGRILRLHQRVKLRAEMLRMRQRLPRARAFGDTGERSCYPGEFIMRDACEKMLLVQKAEVSKSGTLAGAGQG